LKIDILLYLESQLTDDDLILMEKFIPESISENFNNFDKINNLYYSIPEKYNGKLSGIDNSHVRKNKDDVEYWKGIFNKTGSDHIIKIFADSPFLDIAIINEMLELHLQSLADFTFSENLPSVIAGEIMSKELIESIPDIDEKTLPLTEVIKSNINQFDVELYYKNPDLRDKRISFRNSNRRDKRIMESIINSSGNIPVYTELKGIIEKSPEHLYLGPSFLEIELTGRCSLDCIFCYRTSLKDEHKDMDIDSFKKIIEEMRSFNLPYTVCFGGSGEPMLNKNFYEILEYADKEDLIERIIIETNGLSADSNFITFLNNSSFKITTIFNINGYDPETYKTLHGKDHFDKVFNNISSCIEQKNMLDKIYIQIMKINETEKFLDKYYDFWDNYKIPIILQKQNTYLGRIKDRRYSDLSPLERVPCWHLQRDLYILSDSRVSFCKEDIDGDNSSCDLKKESLQNIWNKKREYFLNDYHKEFSVKPDCKLCDEWYTFNF